MSTPFVGEVSALHQTRDGVRNLLDICGNRRARYHRLDDLALSASADGAVALEGGYHTLVPFVEKTFPRAKEVVAHLRVQW